MDNNNHSEALNDKTNLPAKYGEYPGEYQYEDCLERKWSLRLSEVIKKEEMLARNLKKAKEAAVSPKKYFDKTGKTIQDIRDEAPLIESYYLDTTFIKPHWEAFKKKHSGKPIETIWDIYIKETEDDIIEFDKEQFVASLRLKFEPLINKEKEEKRKSKSMFSRMFSRGGKKRSRKTKKRRR